jgi:hypothetical protein
MPIARSAGNLADCPTGHLIGTAVTIFALCFGHSFALLPDFPVARFSGLCCSRK